MRSPRIPSLPGPVTGSDSGIAVRKSVSDMKVEARSPSGARVELACAARSDVGRRRSVNEDSWGARFPLYFVADGMGGHKAGDVASQKVVSSLFGALPDERFITASELSAALAQVAVDLYELGVGVGAPGSTLTGFAVHEHRGLPCALVFNIGDSRTYLLSQGSFEQVTVDHSEVQELIDAGEVDEVEARALPRQNVITRALGAGSGPDVAADLFMVPLQSGDRWVMCSDGLSGEVTSALLEMIVRSVSDPQAVADELISQALNAGGKDNVTVLIVDVINAEPPWEDHSADQTVDSDENTIPRPAHTAPATSEGE